MRADKPARTTTVGVLAFLRSRGIIVLWIVMLIVFAATSPVFATPTNFALILGAAAVTSIFAASVAFGVMSGALDLSIPGTAAFAGVTVGLLLNAGVPPVIAIAIGLAVGVGIGAVNGLIVLRGLNPLVVTIGMLAVLGGLASVLSKGIPVTGLTSLRFIGTDRYLGVPAPVYVVVILYVIGTLFLTRMRSGVRMLAVGGNAEAVRRSGVRSDRYRVLGFVLGGVCAALGGIVTAAIVTQASPAASPGILFEALTAVALSGLALTGGRGSLPLVLVGALVIATINSYLVIQNVQPYWTDVITGALLIGALALDKYTGGLVSSRLIADASSLAGRGRAQGK
ncbi:ABC transporter permease [Microbacterium sp. 18062]|uniref:ABC transporter permease n=1 Tax=Microbacterium sp. 18062 TaxID=2681410 RepID=UPI001357B1D7|nr:ABC transporter permease [Microbacterium sp. 18062]